MDTHTLTVLEFDKVLSFLKQYVTSPQGGRLCERLIPLHNPQEIKALLSEVTEMKTLLTIYDEIPIHGIKDIEDATHKTRVEGFYLEPRVLQDICSTLTTARTLKTFFKTTASKNSSLQNITGKFIPLKELEGSIKKAIGNQGEILDTASKELQSLRQTIKHLRLDINKKLEELLSRENLSFIFQEQLITIRNGRFVLPVKIDHKGYLPGVVHDQSHSKATYFIEPLSVVTLNNELQILRKEEIHEEVRILSSLTSQVRERKAEILFNLSLLGKLDLIYAKAKLSISLNACEPMLNDDGLIMLNSCKHPMLMAHYEPAPPPPDSSKEDPESPGQWLFDSSQVVPVTLHMERGINTLIITGANAGGKTVTLKTLGILALMAQSGMHIPAEEGSTLPVFQSIFANIGDEQNIEESLSTFSAHIHRLDQILKETDEHSLVLIDELGSGTDPAEGAALGLSILDYLRQQNSSTVITTHLTLLKTYAYPHNEVENVSVEFDPVTLKPTYNLVYGMPGLSNALAIARNMGMSDTILHNAHNYLEEKDKQVLELIRGLEQSQKAVALKKDEIAKLQGKVSDHEHLVESLLKNIKARKLKLLREYEHTFNNYIQEAESKLEKIVNEARLKEKPFLKERQKKIREVKKEWKAHLPSPSEERQPVESLKAGQAVTLLHFNKEGVVVKVDNHLKKAEIMVGDIKIKARFDAIASIKGEKLPEDTPPPPVKKSQFKKTSTLSVPAEEVPQQINVIGMTVDESLPFVDKTIDQAIIGGHKKIEIIHGLGTGRLKAGIRKHLKEHNYVKSFGSDEQSRGGAGVTQVEIQFQPGNRSRKSHQKA